MKVLVVVDMQKDFITGSLGTKEAVEIVPKVVEKIKNYDGHICFTMDTHHAGYLSTQEGRYLPVEHCIIGRDGWDLHHDIKNAIPEREEDTIDFFKKNAFGSKDLVLDLMDLNDKYGIEEIELVGLCTDICVISNALMLKSWFPEVKIKVDASCCAGVTPESHKNALKAMKMCQIDIVGEETEND